ncbi:hypothetical protein M011DRAFT_411182 [Sporormia fimetaria CBS 119925]|uniref:Mediator of RNA polymerase II transcription subunit 16 n=1 Tax=Sporormia fimetaria CBS 119925 TaxID=1340428 RepID=A0A6A6UYA2_9PLEO|nr:hypothetical protein M011DRAFT_411182 [Sporormia fimetaria CBS 119925]
MDDTAYTMDVDDLFGDSDEVALPSVAVPPVKGLARRVDEMGTVGCCQRIAWSKSGCVAYISPDGYGVYLKVFSRNSSNSKWDLAKDTQLEIPLQHNDFPYVHLSWSHLGNDLAVVDAAGRVLVFSCQGVMNRMALTRVNMSQTEAELDAVVGMNWLAMKPYEQKNHIVWSATGKGDNWSFVTASHIFKDALHPLESKASIIYLKRFGELRLRFQQADSTWHEISTQIGVLVSVQDAYTHAAFASNNDESLLLAAYDVSSRLHLYRIEVKWNVPPPRPGQRIENFEKPEVAVTKILTEEMAYPVSSTSATGDAHSSVSTVGRVAAQLTHLGFLPKTPDQTDGSVPTIHAIFVSPPNCVNLDQTQHPNPSSILVRWGVHNAPQNQLHASLDQVTSKKKSINSVPMREICTIKRLPDIAFSSVVLAAYPLWYSMTLAFCYGDGTIELRKRATMEVISPDYNTETVTSLSQAGFAFPNPEQFLYAALSPNHCIAACMQEDGTLKLRTMEYTHGSLSSSEDDPKHAAALAALVLQSASAANQYLSSDDLFATMGELSERRKSEFVLLMFQALSVNIDCCTDESQGNALMLLGRSPYFVKTLSAAHLLGLRGRIERSIPSRLAWATINIKYVTQVLTTISRMHGPGYEKSIIRPEWVPPLVGVFRWMLHFIIYMMGDLFQVGLALRRVPPSDLEGNAQATIQATIESTDKPGILLLLCSFPRMMQKLWSQPLVWIMTCSMRIASTATNPEMRRIYAPLYAARASFPFDMRYFDQILTEAHNLVRQSYKSAGLSESQRNRVERELLLGRLPTVLVPAAKRLLTDVLFGERPGHARLAEKINIANLMAFDKRWLGVENFRRARNWHDAHVVDVCQKYIIRGAERDTVVVASNSTTDAAKRSRGDSVGATGMPGLGSENAKKKDRLRCCTRCGAFMEDVLLGMQGYTPHNVQWLAGVAKHCICGNGWMLVEGPFVKTE